MLPRNAGKERSGSPLIRRALRRRVLREVEQDGIVIHLGELIADPLEVAQRAAHDAGSRRLLKECHAFMHDGTEQTKPKALESEQQRCAATE